MRFPSPHAWPAPLAVTLLLSIGCGNGTEPPTSDPVLVGAGDIASCLSTNDEATAQLLDTIPGTVFTAGDNDYSDGAVPPPYGVCFDSTWGRHRARLRPAAGDDDRRGTGLTLDDYYAYFGAAAHPPTGAYSFDLGRWHIVVLNATPSVDTAQLSWLRADLTAHPTLCALAIAHRPRFSSGNTGSSPGMGAVFQVLYDHHVELLISGNDHDYERFAPQAPDQTVDAAGVVQLVVGTGGKSHGRINVPLELNSLVQNDDSYGVLRLALHATSYEWLFVPVAGRTFSDAGQRPCH